MDNSAIIDNQSSNHPIIIEYDNFMKWFKENHPDLHEKYGRNIRIPFQIDGGVCISPDFKISQEEQDMLLEIAQKYYHPDK
jgi:hypothetical protein